MVASTVAAVLSVAAPVAAATNPCGSTGVRDGSSCLYMTKGTDTFTVPAYIESATFTVYGASVFGTDGHAGSSNFRYGGMSKGTLEVTSGRTLQVNVGGAPVGGDDTDIAKFGGFNGGGDSGSGSTDIGCCSLGGAGASDIRVGSYALTDRIFVAGGAGGQGAIAALSGVTQAPGGEGGGANGQNGTSIGGSTDGAGGGGGTQGGAGASPGNAGSAGRGFGGTGGADVPGVATGGAGGGGGYYGGGGTSTVFGVPGGGGGGSGYITPDATDTSSRVGGAADLNSDDRFDDVNGGGVVKISWPGDSLTASVELTSDRTSPVPETTVITFRTRVSASNGALPQGTILLIDNGTRNLAQGSLEPTDDGFMEFVFKKNSDTFTAGSHSIVARYEDAFGVLANASSSAVEFTLAPRSQTISFTSTAPTDAIADHSTYDVSANATSGLPVTFRLDSPTSDEVCTLTGSRVTFIGAGTCGVIATQSGDSAFKPADIVTQNITVGTAQSQTITFTSTAPTDAKFDDTYTVSATGGDSGNPVTFSVGENRACRIDGTVVTIVDFGCEIHADQAAGNGYTAAPRVTQMIVLPPQAQAITFTTTAPSDPQIGDTYTIKAKSDSSLPVTLGLDGDSAGCTLGASTVSSGLGGVVTSAVVSFSGAGTCRVNANQTGLATYYLPAPQTQQAMTVDGGPQVIAFTSDPPTDAKYGGSTSVTATGGDSGNPVTFSTDSSDVCEIGGSTVSFVGVGDCVVDADQAGNDFFPAAETVSQTITVAKAPLVVVAPSATKVYGESWGSPGPTYETLVNGDTAQDLDTQPTCGPALPGGQSSFVVGSYTVSCTGAADASYAITYRAGTFTVKKAAVVITPLPVGTRWPLFIGRLTFSATVTNATTGAPVFDVPVTFTARPLVPKTLTCPDSSDIHGVATCRTRVTMLRTPSTFSVGTAATHNYLAGSGVGTMTFVGRGGQ
jgi:hypothetical protein